MAKPAMTALKNKVIYRWQPRLDKFCYFSLSTTNETGVQEVLKSKEECPRGYSMGCNSGNLLSILSSQQFQGLYFARNLIPGHSGHLHLGRERERNKGSKEEKGVCGTFPAGYLLSSNIYFIPVKQHYRSVPNHQHWIVILDLSLCVTAPHVQKISIFNCLSWKSRWKWPFGTAGQTSRPF